MDNEKSMLDKRLKEKKKLFKERLIVDYDSIKKGSDVRLEKRSGQFCIINGRRVGIIPDIRYSKWALWTPSRTMTMSTLREIVHLYQIFDEEEIRDLTEILRSLGSL